MPRKRKPHDPAASARAMADRRAEDENATHAEQYGASVTRDRAGRVSSIYRSNVFRRLLDAKTINQGHHDAAYRLVEMWATWKGLEGRSARSEYVDGGDGSAELVTDRMIRAGRDVARVMACVGPLDRILLEAFMVATVEEDRPMHWRGIVERVASVHQRERQSTVVVMALENLRLVFEAPRAKAA